MVVGKEIKRRERQRREKQKSSDKRQTAGWQKEREEELYRERERRWETFREKDSQRWIETREAQNQFDIGIDPYSRNVKYLFGKIVSEKQAIRIITVLLVTFILLLRQLLFIFSRSGEIITGTCHEESHLGSRRLCGLP